MTSHQSPASTAVSLERQDLLKILQTRRFFLRQTVAGLSDEQAAARPTVSELCLGGLIKHVSRTESGWAQFIVDGPVALGGGKNFDEMTDDDWAARVNEFAMLDGETLADLLAEYEQVAASTDALLLNLPDLDAGQPLPEAPWYEPGASWSARQVFLHIAGETAQHAGHADILRETIDGAKTMG